MKTQGFSIRFNGLLGFVLMVAVFVALFFIAKGIFTLLAWVAPVLILAALLINYRTILNYLKFMLSLLRRNPLGGILGIILSVVGFPILAGVLFGKSILDRKVKKLQDAYRAQEQPEFTEYEEVIRPQREERIELPPLEQRPRENKDNRYEDLF